MVVLPLLSMLAGQSSVSMGMEFSRVVGDSDTDKR